MSKCDAMRRDATLQCRPHLLCRYSQACVFQNSPAQLERKARPATRDLRPPISDLRPGTRLGPRIPMHASMHLDFCFRFITRRLKPLGSRRFDFPPLHLIQSQSQTPRASFLTRSHACCATFRSLLYISAPATSSDPPDDSTARL